MWNKKNFEDKVLKSVFVEIGLRILALNVPKSKTLNAIISELLFCDLSTFRTGLFIRIFKAAQRKRNDN